jgi:hypothetical protein
MTSFSRLKRFLLLDELQLLIANILNLEKHLQKSFMELGEISATIATIKFYLAKDLGVIQLLALLAEASVLILDKARSKNYPVGYFEKFLTIIAF